jgi:Arsenical resistance operon protein ArsD
MTQPIPISDLFQEKATTADVEIFDPPMCCPTGMCGPTIDQTLLDLNEMVMALQAQGVSVARYQMTTHPNAFLGNAEVMKLVREQQMAALPITAVRGKIIKTKTYPPLVEVKTHLDGVNS